MLEGRTIHGFKFQIPRKRLESYRFTEMVNEVDDNPVRITVLVKYLLGEEQKNALIEFLGGDPSNEEMGEELKAIFDAIRSDKDSKKS